MRYFLAVIFLIHFSVFADQQYKTHRVSSGETVESIAEEYGVPATEIYKLNPDAKKGISRGTTLIIPPKTIISQEPEGSFTVHKVRKKETLYSLSKEYNVSIEEIKRYNKFLYAEPLKKGTKLRIPKRPKLSQTSPAITQEEAPSEENIFREHIVLPKETKYGISKKYNITIDELEEMNPWMDSLQPGMMLKIKVGETAPSIDLDKFFIYEVSPKETIYSLTREYNISRDSLFALNPQLKDGLKVGMELKLPKQLEIEAADYFSESENLENRLEFFETKNLVLMLPFKLDEIETDSIALAKERVRKDQVLQIALDFYSGVRMALDSAKTKGLSVNLQVMDTKQNAFEIRRLIAENNFENVDAVIGPLLQNLAETAARELENKNIPIVSPLSTKEVGGLENFVQTRPSREMMESVMLNFLVENTENKNVILIAGNGFSGIKNRILSALPNAKVVDVSSNGTVSQSALIGALEKGRENWVILESDNIGTVSSLTSRLNSYVSSYNISLFTTNKNDVYDNESVSNYHLGNLNFHFPSVDKEFDVLKNKDFVMAYRKRYGLSPNQYAVRGFDITYDVLMRLGAFGSIEDSFAHFEGTTEYAENKFHYQKRQDGTYFNNALYIIKYDKNLNRKVVK